ncbi:MAG: hypothetical protein WC242_02360 [Candidatus Paceibacterota bacterium]|jgi:hypothetical protein
MVNKRAEINIQWDKGIAPLRNLHFDRQHSGHIVYTPDDLIQEISIGFPVFPNKWFGQIIIKGKPCLREILEKIEKLGQEFHCFRETRIDPVGDFKRDGDQSECSYVYEIGVECNPFVYWNVCAYIFVRYLSPEFCTIEIILGIDRITEDNHPSFMDTIKFEEFDANTIRMILRAFDRCMSQLLSKIHEVHAASKQQPWDQL